MLNVCILTQIKSFEQCMKQKKGAKMYIKHTIQDYDKHLQTFGSTEEKFKMCPCRILRTCLLSFIVQKLDDGSMLQNRFNKENINRMHRSVPSPLFPTMCRRRSLFHRCRRLHASDQESDVLTVWSAPIIGSHSGLLWPSDRQFGQWSLWDTAIYWFLLIDAKLWKTGNL